MATTIRGNVRMNVEFFEIISNGPTAGALPSRINEVLNLSNGTSNGQIDLAYAARATGIGSSATTVYNLNGDSNFTDTEGNQIDFAEVVLIAVKERTGTAANVLQVGPDATNGFGVLASNVGFWADASDRSVVPANSWYVTYCEAGVPVTDASTDELAIITGGSASNAAWDLIILGRSA